MSASLQPVADRVWVGYAECGLLAVAGTRGVLLVDAPADGRSASWPVEEVRRLGAGEVAAVALTHGHDRHRAALDEILAAWPSAEVLAHEDAGVPRATRTFSSAAFVDLGDRVVELVHPGAGHTAGDVVARVPDADVVAVGDLVGGDGVPGYGPDCHPLALPATLDLLLGMTTAGTVVVPGHGPVLDRDALDRQRGDAGVVAETVYDLASRSTPVADALGAAAWPFPAERLADAVARGLAQVPRTQRRLPLV